MAANSGEADKAALVDVLLRVPVMQESDSRALVLNELTERGYPLSVNRSPRDRYDVWAILTACLRQPGALAALVEVLRGVEGENQAVTEFSRLAGQLTSGEAPARPSPQGTQPAGQERELDSHIRVIARDPGELISAFPEIRRERLHCGSQLGAGARGRVFSLPDDPDLVYKEYISARVNGSALAELILQRNMLGDAERRILDESTAWPLARVMTDRHTVGCLMRSFPDDFYVTLPVGQRPAYLSYLCYPPKPVWENIGLPSVQDRLEIARQVVNLVSFLQRYSLVIGDVSAQNLLWTCHMVPRIFLLGCDALRSLGESSALPEGETPDWRDPLLGSRDPDMDSDNYKMALVIGRILSQQPYAQPGQELPLLNEVPQAVANGVRARFAEAARPAGQRPTAANWAEALTIPQAPRIRWPLEPAATFASMLPLYVVCDVTETADKSVLGYTNELADALREISGDPTVADKTRVCIATFSDQAKVLMPLSDLSEGTGIPPLVYAGDTRRYGPAFTLMKSLIERDARDLRASGYNVMRPAMIFISTGPPADDWSASYNALNNSRSRPHIFTWGVGAAEQADLTKISNAYNFSGTNISPAVIVRSYAQTFANSDISRSPMPFRRIVQADTDTDPSGFQAIDLEYLRTDDEG